MDFKYKIADVAKEFGVPAKKVIETVTGVTGEAYKTGGTFEEKELNVLLETLTRENAEASLDAYLASGKSPPRPRRQKRSPSRRSSPPRPRSPSAARISVLFPLPAAPVIPTNERQDGKVDAVQDGLGPFSITKRQLRDFDHGMLLLEDGLSGDNQAASASGRRAEPG